MATNTDQATKTLNTIEEALAAFRDEGKFAIVVDDFDRENEGDLIMPSEIATKESLALMVRECTGLICCSITSERADELNLPPMVPNNSDPHKTAFTISVDYKYGTTTGISAHDRATTIKALGGVASEQVVAKDFTRPGHILPLVYHSGGVLMRGGHTEAAVDLSVAAGYPPSGYLCEIQEEDGTMSRLPQLIARAQKLELPLISIADLVKYRYDGAVHDVGIFLLRNRTDTAGMRDRPSTNISSSPLYYSHSQGLYSCTSSSSMTILDSFRGEIISCISEEDRQALSGGDVLIAGFWIIYRCPDGAVASVQRNAYCGSFPDFTHTHSPSAYNVQHPPIVDSLIGKVLWKTEKLSPTLSDKATAECWQSVILACSKYCVTPKVMNTTLCCWTVAREDDRLVMPVPALWRILPFKDSEGCKISRMDIGLVKRLSSHLKSDCKTPNGNCVH